MDSQPIPRLNVKLIPTMVERLKERRRISEPSFRKFANRGNISVGLVLPAFCSCDDHPLPLTTSQETVVVLGGGMLGLAWLGLGRI